jgi:hypothetical protein
MSTQGKGGGRIRTSDLRFIRHGPQPIELPLGDHNLLALPCGIIIKIKTLLLKNNNKKIKTLIEKFYFSLFTPKDFSILNNFFFLKKNQMDS